MQGSEEGGSTCASANAARPHACAAAGRRGSGDDASSNRALEAARPSGKEQPVARREPVTRSATAAREEEEQERWERMMELQAGEAARRADRTLDV